MTRAQSSKSIHFLNCKNNPDCAFLHYTSENATETATLHQLLDLFWFKVRVLQNSVVDYAFIIL